MTPSVEKYKVESDIDKQFPSIETAYPIAINSYEMAQKRYEAMDNKLQSLISFGTTIALAVPIFLKGSGLNFHSPLFIAAAVVFVLAIVVGLYARFTGSIILPRPTSFYDDWLHKDICQFKLDLICFAGEHFDENCKTINQKAKLATMSALMIFISVFLLAVWMLWV